MLKSSQYDSPVPKTRLKPCTSSTRLHANRLMSQIFMFGDTDNTPTYFFSTKANARAGIAPPVERRTTGWTVGFRFQVGASDLSLLHSVQIESEAHAVS
jgi:hypothetical protein